MYESIDLFSTTQFLANTYPTTDDSESKKALLEFLQKNIIKKSPYSIENIDSLISSISHRLDAISHLCCNIEDLDQAPIEAVDQICNSIDLDIKRSLSNATDNIVLNNNNDSFLNVNCLPDTIRFYHHLIASRTIPCHMSRKQLYKIYRNLRLRSHFSNVLFAMSWLNILYVHNKSYVFFNPHPPLFI